MDALSARAESIQKVVQGRKNTRLQACASWIREDLDSHPSKSLRPDFYPLAPLSCLQACWLSLWVWDPATTRCSPRWSPSCYLLRHFLTLWRTTFPSFALLDLPILRREELYDAAMMKGVFDGWAWNDIKAMFWLGCDLKPLLREKMSVGVCPPPPPKKMSLREKCR